MFTVSIWFHIVIHRNVRVFSLEIPQISQECSNIAISLDIKLIEIKILYYFMAYTVQQDFSNQKFWTARIIKNIRKSTKKYGKQTEIIFQKWKDRPTRISTRIWVKTHFVVLRKIADRVVRSKNDTCSTKSRGMHLLQPEWENECNECQIVSVCAIRCSKGKTKSLLE